MVSLSLGTAAHAAEEVHVYGIAKFGGGGECGSQSQTHSIHTTTAAVFRDAFSDWDSVATNNNKNAKRTYFKGKGSPTADTMDVRGVDDADVIYVHTHGGHSLSGNYTSLSMGSAAEGCSARTSNDMLFNSDLDIAVIKACQSGDYEVWQQGGYSAMVPHTSTFTMWNAFHGNSSCGIHVAAYVGLYALTSFDDGVGESWLDFAYWNNWFGDDDCPVSIVWGDSAAKRHNMYENGGFSDRKNTGAKTGSSIFFIGGCEPEKGVELPD
ncbi:MAG: hypothetical protein IT381_29355 [Deltaproteobacteria bacterium]|nr:hypothetical protein [Deltaproteobacteria bacterium]